MALAAQQSHLITNIQVSKTVTSTSKFSKLCKELEGYRILLISVMLIFQGCIVVPVTLLTTSFIDLGLGGITVSLMAAGTLGVLVTNMAEAPIKAIIITFLLSVVSSISLIAIHLLS